MKANAFSRHKKPLNASMNVVPYIDVMLVLLVIFMVTTPMLTTGVDIDLPKEQTHTINSESQLPAIISLTKDGDLFISYEGVIDQPIQADELSQILQDLQQQSQTAGNPLQVMINADQSNSYNSVMALMASIQKAGIQKVGLLTNAQDKPSKKR